MPRSELFPACLSFGEERGVLNSTVPYLSQTPTASRSPSGAHPEECHTIGKYLESRPHTQTTHHHPPDPSSPPPSVQRIECVRAFHNAESSSINMQPAPVCAHETRDPKKEKWHRKKCTKQNLFFFLLLWGFSSMNS